MPALNTEDLQERIRVNMDGNQTPESLTFLFQQFFREQQSQAVAVLAAPEVEMEEITDSEAEGTAPPAGQSPAKS